jgi:hypothetical protein
MTDATPETPTPATPPAGAAAPATPLAASATAAAAAEPAAPKIKAKKPTMRACDEKDAKGKLCCGHLKRWYDYPKEIEALVGKKTEIYRCEFCHTIYKPGHTQAPRSYTIRY